MMTIIAMAIAFAGLAGIAVPMRRHQMEALSRKLSSRQCLLLRVVGVSLLTLSAVCCMETYGVSIGLACWFGLLAVAGSALVLLLTYRPSAVPVAGVGTGLIVAGCFLTFRSFLILPLS